MATQTIAQLNEITTTTDSSYLPVWDGSPLKKMSVANLRALLVKVGVASKATLIALSGGIVPSIQMLGRSTVGDAGAGLFAWNSGNCSAFVTNDPQGGIWIAPSSDITGASGAWQRLFSGDLFPGWFGAFVGVSGADVGLQAMYDYAFKYGHSTRIPNANDGVNIYLIANMVTVRQPNTTFPTDYNSRKSPPPQHVIDDGVTIKATASMTHMWRYGDGSSDYSQYWRFPQIAGGTFDGNFLASYCVWVPGALEPTIHRQHCKNYVLAGWHLGDSTTSDGYRQCAGARLKDCSTDRSLFSFTVTAISQANPAVVTAAGHGMTSGQIFYISGSSMTQLNGTWSRVSVVDANNFQLVNVNSTAYTPFTGTATGYRCSLSSFRLQNGIVGVSKANPCVITTQGAHGYTTGDTVAHADCFGVPQLDGNYTVTVLTSTTYSIGVDSTSWGTWANSHGNGISGWSWQYVSDSLCEAAIYCDQAGDLEVSDCKFQGNRIGIRNNQSTSGYDAKLTNVHFYNYNEQGELLYGTDFIGSCKFVGLQCDAPFKYAYRFRGAANTLIGCTVNYDTNLITYDTYASPVRLAVGDSTAACRVIGGAWKTGSSSKRLYRDCSGAQGNFRVTGCDHQYVWGPVDGREIYLPALLGSFVGGTGGGALVVSNGNNLASVTRNGVGDYTLNFNNPVDVNAVITYGCSFAGGGQTFMATEDSGSKTQFTRRVLFTTDYQRGDAIVYDLNGTDQTGIPNQTYTIITGLTKRTDRNNTFVGSTGKWTPNAGLIQFGATVSFSTITAGQAFLAVFKNNSHFRDGPAMTLDTNFRGVSINIIDECNGTDVYDIRVYMQATGGGSAVSGAISSTHIEGHHLEPKFKLQDPATVSVMAYGLI